MSTRRAMSTRFDLKFLRVFSKNRYSGKLHSTFDSRAELPLLSLLKEVKPSTNRKNNDKTSNFDNSFPPVGHSCLFL